LVFNNSVLKDERGSLKLFLVVLSFLFYSALFFLLFHVTDQRISALSLLPIIAVSLLYGIKKGIISSLILIPVNAFYLFIAGFPSVEVMIQNFPGVIGSVALAAALGYLHDLQEKSKQQLKIIEKEISERKKAEEKLFDIQRNFTSELQKNIINFDKTGSIEKGGINNIPQKVYQEIAENAADIIYTVNLDGYFTFGNRMGLNSTGFTLDELQKIKYTDLVIPEYKTKVKHFYFHQFLKRELNTYLEFPFRLKDGSVKWYGQNATLIFENEKISGFMVIARDITDRKIIEDELKESGEILRSITYTANDAIISTDSSNNIIQWNKSAERMYGYSEAEISGKSIKEIVPPRYRKNFEMTMRSEDKPNREDNAKTLERWGFRKDGSIFPTEVSIAEWKRNNKKFYTHIIRDITERKEAEFRFKQSERDYRQLFASAHEPILLIKPEGEIILEANERACKVYGYEHSEFVGMSLKQISKDVKRGEEKISETLREGYFINFETIQYNRQGKELYFEVNASVTEYKGEKVILLLNRDITERILAERKIEEYNNKLEKLVEERTKKLEETNVLLHKEIQKLTEADLKIQNQVEFFKTLINTIPIPVFVKNENNCYSDCNKAFEDFLGISKENIIDKEKINLIPSEEVTNINNNSVYETNIIDKEGKNHEVIIYQAVLLNRNNVSETLVGVILDITQQKKMQEEVKKALEAEKELNVLKSRFVSTASHEFRTPLTSIMASAELLLRYYHKWDDDKKLSTVTRIQNSAEYMNGLISNVLTLNKSESGRITFNPEKVEVVGLCSSIVEEIKMTAEPEHKFKFHSTHPKIEGNFDGVLIRQFIGNLLSNAVKYSPSNGVIQFSLIKNDRNVIFVVKDNGIGISEEDQQNLFQPFFRGTNISNIPGTGLGLSILKKAVELHKGKLEFWSKINVGSRFKITIPFS
jgi:hypothetical protein